MVTEMQSTMQNPLGLSPEALQIAAERPKAWRYRLFAQVLIDDVNACNEIPLQMHLMPARELNIIPLIEFPLWVQSKLDDLVSIATELGECINADWESAFGLAGKPTTLESMVTYTRQVVRHYCRAIKWRIDVQYTPVDSRCRDVMEELAPLANSLIDSVEQFGPSIVSQLDHALNISEGNEKIEMTLLFTLPPPNTSPLLKKLKQLGDSIGDGRAII